LYETSFDDLSPKREVLEGLDAILCDLPDVGSRYYTFVWTTALMMKACAARGIPVVVLDRPNPLGGAVVEGNLPDDERLLSFVGLHPLPVRHGMTPGEIARWVNELRGVGCDLRVVAMREGAQPPARDRLDGKGSAWVLPSPNMPTRETAVVYPGACLVEGTNLSEGRGTTRPFELIGAPWLDADRAAEAASRLDLPGVTFRPHVFKPTFQKHAGLLCGGVQLHVTDENVFRPYETGLGLVKALRDLDPVSFRWRTEAYEYRSDVPAIDLLTGTSRYRSLVDAGKPLAEWTASFPADLARFGAERERSLLYPAASRAILLVGAHESGKTTLAEKLIAAFAAEGFHVGSVKHTDHEYETDLPGKDSQRHAAAGANPAVLVAGRRVASHGAGKEPPPLAALLAGSLADADVVVVEGYKRTAGFPKIEVVRAATGREPVAEREIGVVAVVADRATRHPDSVRRLAFHEFDELYALVKKNLGLAS
ncbi:MAG TPA: molybdopterin-guanine dinucleotide biosynthesis protein B, partial [Thermoanaerobaculia bacterium]|nr:molybdopterin-guanine dinucleotide biosynthesis protein B [Thermoanaerobaculia bacterium]